MGNVDKSPRIPRQNFWDEEKGEEYVDVEGEDEGEDAGTNNPSDRCVDEVIGLKNDRRR